MRTTKKPRAEATRPRLHFFARKVPARSACGSYPDFRRLHLQAGRSQWRDRGRFTRPSLPGTRIVIPRSLRADSQIFHGKSMLRKRRCQIAVSGCNEVFARRRFRGNCCAPCGEPSAEQVIPVDGGNGSGQAIHYPVCGILPVDLIGGKCTKIDGIELREAFDRTRNFRFVLCDVELQLS